MRLSLLPNHRLPVKVSVVSAQSYWNGLYRAATLAIIGLALTGVFLAFFPKIAQHRRYQESKELLEADIRQKEDEIQLLRLNQNRLLTDRYFVQQLAHEIGYAHKDEVIFEFVDAPAQTNMAGSADE